MINITYKTHTTGGFLLGLLFIGPFLANLFDTFNLVSISIMYFLYSYFLYLGSISPDIDHPSSHIGKNFTLISKKIYSKYGHRTITHSLFCVLYLMAFSCLVFIILKLFFYNIYLQYKIYIFPIPIGFILGYISHIILDMFSPRGVSLFYPYEKKYRLPLAPTIVVNSSAERNFNTYLAFLTCILLSIYIFAFLYTFIRILF